MESKELILTAKEFWNEIQKKGGLNIKDEFYDKPIIDAIIANLNLPVGTDLQKLLAKDFISTEEFLYAFFLAVAPFSKMMGDLLAMFEKAGAKHSSGSLEIAFDFGHKNNELKFNIEQFKNWYEKWELYTRKCTTRFWNYSLLWKLNDIFRDNKRHGSTQIRDTKARMWLEIYAENRLVWPDEFPEFPKIADTSLSHVIKLSWDILKLIVENSKRYGASRQTLIDIARAQNFQDSEEFKGLLGPGVLGRLDTDHWSASLLDGIFTKLEEIERLNPLDRQNTITPIVSKVTDLFASLPEYVTSVEEKREIITEFLDLPIWKRRHELYSTWISTQILEAIGYEHLKIHHVNGTLVFAFSGTHFATTTDFEPDLYVWAEVRSPLQSPVGKSRTSSIQPDYSILMPPINTAASAILVVECKQYKKQSTEKNFIEALLDYANARPNAKIILVNYGPANVNLVDYEILKSVKTRLRVIGRMNPECKQSLQLFKTEVFQAIEPYALIKKHDILNITQNISSAYSGQIKLSWEAIPRDIDLILNLKTAKQFSISYRNKGSEGEFPNAYLIRDVTDGYGPEIIVVAAWHKGVYNFYVHNFSQEKKLRESNAFVEFELNGNNIKIDCPSEGEGNYWNVFVFDTETHEIGIINAIVENEPIIQSRVISLSMAKVRAIKGQPIPSVTTKS